MKLPSAREGLVMALVAGAVASGLAHAPTVHAANSGSVEAERIRYAAPANVLGTRALRCAGYDGSGITVGIIDTGIAPRTRVLRGRLVAFHDALEQRGGVFDDNGHGTAMAALVTSIAPGTRIMMARAAHASGEIDVNAVKRSMSWLATPGGRWGRPHIVLMSFQTGRLDPRLRRGVLRLKRRGIAVVAAAGNTGPGVGSLTTPADYPEVLAVGALTAQGAVASFSGRGPVRRPAPPGSQPPPGMLVKPDVMAPGVRIAVPPQARRPGGATGTSHAAALAAGALALAAQARPKMRGQRLIQLARLRARDMAPRGRDGASGYGRLDVAAMMHPRDPARARCLRSR